MPDTSRKAAESHRALLGAYTMDRHVGSMTGRGSACKGSVPAAQAGVEVSIYSMVKSYS